MEYQNDDKIEKLCEDFKAVFNDRIICLLYHGSNAYKREVKKTSDFDLCLVLHKRKANDLGKIRKIA